EAGELVHAVGYEDERQILRWHRACQAVLDDPALDDNGPLAVAVPDLLARGGVDQRIEGGDTGQDIGFGEPVIGVINFDYVASGGDLAAQLVRQVGRPHGRP